MWTDRAEVLAKPLLKKLRKELPEDTQIIALGTNALATTLMLKAGANEGASGENAIVFNAPKVDIIVGPIGIISANSMMGELTPLMAAAIAESPARKILIPLNRCNIEIAGVKNEPLPYYIEHAVEMVKKYVEGHIA